MADVVTGKVDVRGVAVDSAPDRHLAPSDSLESDADDAGNIESLEDESSDSVDPEEVES